MAYYKQLAATAQVKIGAGRLYSITVSTTSSGTLTIYDSPAGSTGDPKIFDTITPAAGATYFFPMGAQFNTGLYVVVANSLSFTLTYE